MEHQLGIRASTASAACDAFVVSSDFAGATVTSHSFGVDVQGRVNQCMVYYTNAGGPMYMQETIVQIITGCPAYSTLNNKNSCDCKDGFAETPTHTSCQAAAPELPSGPPICSRSHVPAGALAGNPIFLASAEKFRAETDWSDSGPDALSFVRTYRSTWAGGTAAPASGLGQVWSHNYNTGLTATPSTDPLTVTLSLPAGYLRSFTRADVNSAWTPDAGNGADTLAQLGGAWVWHRADDDSTYSFTADGKLQSVVDRNGRARTYAYNSDGRLISVTNAFGRTLGFAYANGSLTTVTTPDGRVLRYSYDASGRLSSVLYQDGRSRTFVYRNSTYKQALTDIIDEAGVLWGSFGYDEQGRAVSTQLAGGVDTYWVFYPSATGSATVQDPRGTTRTYRYSTTAGKLAVISGSLPSGEGEADAASRVQDANGLITSETDFNGVTTTTTWNVGRRLPTTVVYASGTPEARTVTTQWHATFALPVLVTEAGRTTAYTYDALGNVLSKTVTDTATNKAQLWQWTYTPQGLVSTQTEPNGAVTSYTYDLLGNVLTATNALGHVTSYSYDTANRVVSTTAPNGLVTGYTYDARDRLLTPIRRRPDHHAHLQALRHGRDDHTAHRPRPDLRLRRRPSPDRLEQQPRRVRHLYP
jgi:YD repeat-containing protein